MLEGKRIDVAHKGMLPSHFEESPEDKTLLHIIIPTKSELGLRPYIHSKLPATKTTQTPGLH